MPIAIVDTEQAALIEVAITMLQAALRARVERADPEKIISNSLELQAKKLADVRMMLAQPDPPEWSEMSNEARQNAMVAMDALLQPENAPYAGDFWKRIRALAIASPLPR